MNKYKNKNPNWKGGLTFRVCKICKKEFRGWKSTYCCKKCYLEDMKKHEDKFCLKCGKKIKINSNPAVHNKKKFCSFKCVYGNRDNDIKRRLQRRDIKCKICGKLIRVNHTQLKTRKYCSMECKSQGDRIELYIRLKDQKFKKKWIENRKEKTRQRWADQDYQISMHADTYRQIVFDNLENKCIRCGEKTFSKLEVHHKDENRKNNRMDNLQILCRSCHLKLHKSK